MSALANKFRLNKLSMVDQFVMSYGGLRGAVSFALVLLITKETVPSQEVKDMFVTTTIAVVFFTVFVQVRREISICQYQTQFRIFFVGNHDKTVRELAKCRKG